jgi:hypothetical protein
MERTRNMVLGSLVVALLASSCAAAQGLLAPEPGEPAAVPPILGQPIREAANPLLAPEPISGPPVGATAPSPSADENTPTVFPTPLWAAFRPLTYPPVSRIQMVADPIGPYSSEEGVLQASAQVDAGMIPEIPSVSVSPNTGCPYCGHRNDSLPPGNPYVGMGRCLNCGRGICVPGRRPCYHCEGHDGIITGFLCDLYECICCPDPCFEPHWIPLQDSAFFTDGARPVSQMRMRFENAQHIPFPDRSEFFFARDDGKGKGPKLNPGFVGPGITRYNELDMYIETALSGRFSTFVEYPYLDVDSQFANHGAGFGDISLGTKTLLYDCELLLIGFQMKTTIPSGNFLKGVGTGHMSLDPSLTFALKLNHALYFQGQIGEWIPIGGDSNFAGSVFHANTSLNYVLCRCTPDVPLIATLEIDDYTFQHGLYSDPILGPQRSTGGSYVSAGPGIRLFVCNKVDFGIGGVFAVSEQYFARSLIRMEFRVRF